MTNFTAPHFINECRAREYLVALRWPDGPFCPHCGSLNAKRLPSQRGRATKAHPEGAIRNGVVRHSTLFELVVTGYGISF